MPYTTLDDLNSLLTDSLTRAAEQANARMDELNRVLTRWLSSVAHPAIPPKYGCPPTGAGYSSYLGYWVPIGEPPADA